MRSWSKKRDLACCMSVLGPTMWNLVHDGVIRALLPTHPRVTCYADDTLVIVGGNTKPEVEEAIVECIERVSLLVGENGLALNTGKTDVLCFMDWHYPADTPADEHGWPSVQVDGVAVKTSKSIRYLGVYLDNAGR